MAGLAIVISTDADPESERHDEVGSDQVGR